MQCPWRSIRRAGQRESGGTHRQRMLKVKRVLQKEQPPLDDRLVAKNRARLGALARGDQPESNFVVEIVSHESGIDDQLFSIFQGFALRFGQPCVEVPHLVGAVQINHPGQRG